MTSINDFATTYMCQSLPFGGVKESGFDRFAGVEGLRGLCVVKAVAEDRSVSLTNLQSRLCLRGLIDLPMDGHQQSCCRCACVSA